MTFSGQHLVFLSVSCGHSTHTDPHQPAASFKVSGGGIGGVVEPLIVKDDGPIPV